VWSIRQGAFHHQWDAEGGTTLWVVASAYKKLQERARQLTGPDGRSQDKSFNTATESFVSSLAVHLLFAQWASENWWGYLRWLEQVLEQKTKPALEAESYNPDTFDLIFVQVKEDDANKALMLLDANAEIFTSLQKYYRSLMQNADFDLRSSEACKRATDDFLLQLGDYTHDMKMLSDRAKTLAKITADRKNLVQQRLQARATQRVEQLTVEAQRETNYMKIIAFITMVYLPATFASAFFSTDVVKYQNPNGNGDPAGSGSDNYQSFSPVALGRWGAVTAGLTVLTFLSYFVWVRWPTRGGRDPHKDLGGAV